MPAVDIELVNKIWWQSKAAKQRAIAALKQDTATPEEAYWLDKLCKLRLGTHRWLIFKHDRDKNGKFHQAHVLISKARLGVVAANLAWVKRQVREGERKAAARAKKDAIKNVGAYI